MASSKMVIPMTSGHFIICIAGMDIKRLFELKRELEQNGLELQRTINNCDKELKKLHNTLEKVGQNWKGTIQTSIENMQNVKEVSSKFYNDIASKLSIICQLVPIFKVDKEGDKSHPLAKLYDQFFSSRKERFILYYKGSIYYFSDRECTDLKGEFVLEASDEWVITGCDVTITQPDRTWELSFDNDGDASKFQEICLHK
jgi:hypothetical protein